MKNECTNDNVIVERLDMDGYIGVFSHLIQLGGSGHAQWIYPQIRPDSQSIVEENLFPTTKGLKTKIYMKLVYQYMTIFFNF